MDFKYLTKTSNMKYFALHVSVVVGVVASVCYYFPDADDSFHDKLMYLLFMTVLVCSAFGWLGLKEPWNILVLGDDMDAEAFRSFAVPELAKIIKDKRVVFYTNDTDVIPDEPYDAVVIAVGLRSLMVENDRINAVMESAKQMAVEHFGEIIYRHIVTILAYDDTFAAPDVVPKYIEEYAPEALKDLLDKCDRRWVDIRLGRNPDKQQYDNLQKQFTNVTTENCGSIKHRIILLGGRISNKCNIGNMILNEEVFDNSEPAICVTKERVVSGKIVMVVNTPAVQTETANDPSVENQMEIGESLLLTSPGPRVFVMVVNESDEDKEKEACFHVFENRFGTEAYRHLIVVLNCSQLRRANDPLPHPLQTREDFSQDRLICHYGDCDFNMGNNIQEQILAIVKKPGVETRKKELSLTLIGPAKMGKSHTANSLLGVKKDTIFNTQHQQQPNRISVAMRSVDNYDILIADTPSLNTGQESNENVFKEIEKCAFYPDCSRRPRPIVIVLRGDRASLHEKERECLEIITQQLPQHVERTSIIMFTRRKYQEHNFSGFSHFLDAATDFQARDPNRRHLRNFLSRCHWRCLTFENEISDKEARKTENDKVFRVVEQVMDPEQRLSLVLVGRTGTGKSATANTIISTADAHSTNKFQESIAQMSETEKCQYADFEDAGRKVRLVDTPGLFDTRQQYSNAEIMWELFRCIVHTIPGPHAFLYTINATERFTEEDDNTLKLLKQFFGDGMLRHTILVLTHLDELEETGIGAWDIIDEIIHDPPTSSPSGNNSPKDCGGRQNPLATRTLFESGEYVVTDQCTRKHTATRQQPTIKELLRANGKYAAFSNSIEGRQDYQASGLLKVVEQMNAINEHTHFSNKLYEELVEILKWYGTGTRLNIRYQFGKHPAYANSAVGAAIALVVGGAGVVSGPVAIGAGALASFASYFASRKAP